MTALLVTTLIIGGFHGALANNSASIAHWFGEPGVDWSRTSQWFRYVLINMVPVPGLDKTQIVLRDALFDEGSLVPVVAMSLEMIHKIVALGCVFLLGLALRNLFKVKS